LKIILASASLLESNLSKYYKGDVESLRESHKELLEQINLVIQLADFQEEQHNPELTKSDLIRLNRMISAARNEENDSSQAEEVSGHLEFGDQMMTHLLTRIAPLKRNLVEYVDQLKEIMSI